MAKSDFRATAISGSLTKLIDGTSYLIAGANISITTGSSGAVTVTGTGGGGSSEWARAAGAVYPNTPATTNVLVGDTGVGTADHVLYADGRATFNQQKLSSGDFVVKTDAEEHGLLVKAASNQVLILSGGAAASPHEAGGTDVAFYVSGTQGSQGTSTRGTTLFGGDTVVSGALHARGQFKTSVTNLTGSIFVDPPGPGGYGLGAIVWGSNGGTRTISSASISLSSVGSLLLSSSRSTLQQVNYDQGSIQHWVQGWPHYGTAMNSLLQTAGLNNKAENAFNYHATNIDFKVNGYLRQNAFLVLASSSNRYGAGHVGNAVNGQVLIMSGGAPSSIDCKDMADTIFFVSGTIGSKGSIIRGTSTFGGDLVVSGVLKAGSDDFHAKAGSYVGGTISGSIHHTSGGLSYLVGGSGVTIASGTNGQVTISATGGGGSSEWTRASTPDRVYPNTTSTTMVLIGGTTVADADIILDASGGSAFNAQNNSQDFRVASLNKLAAIKVDGSADQVLILSGGGPTSIDESAGSDVAFYVSGTIGSQQSSVRGASLFGGDVRVSGSLTTLDSFRIKGQQTSPNFYDHSIKADGTVNFNAHNGARVFTIGSYVGRNVVEIANSDSNPTIMFMDEDTGESNGNDLAFYVSGSQFSRGTSDRGAALFGGDLGVSGTLVIGDRQDLAEFHSIEASGSVRAGAGNVGRLEYVVGSFTYDVENAAPRFLPLAKSFEELTLTVGKKGDMMSSLTLPHDGNIKSVKLTLSGSGTASNPGNSKFAFYTSTGATSNPITIDQVGTALTFAAAPSGFVKAESSAVNITNDDGQTWTFAMPANTFFSRDRIMLLAVGFTTGVAPPGSKYHCSYVVELEYNELA